MRMEERAKRSNVLKSSERVTVVPSTLASEEAGMP